MSLPPRLNAILRHSTCFLATAVLASTTAAAAPGAALAQSGSGQWGSSTALGELRFYQGGITGIPVTVQGNSETCPTGSVTVKVDRGYGFNGGSYGPFPLDAYGNVEPQITPRSGGHIP